ncbi:MAG TPA: FAD-dependent oxidoreductase [Pyrinomonadaceae bacterium]|nr:FAD-dependent oxidoreductase [Pyrinomonadaceae bacterium]
MRNRKEQAGAADAVIVGGGVVGLASAHELSRRGASVVVVERGRAGAEASWAAGGMLAPQAEADRADDFFRFQRAARDFYPVFAEELLVETGVDIELDRTGTLYCAFTDEDAEELERRFAWQTRAGLPVERLSAAEARALEPRLSERLRFALRFPLDWQVENRRLVGALLASIKDERRSGVRLLTETRALGVRVERGRAVGVETSRGFVSAGAAVVVAAGAWSSQLAVGESSATLGDANPHTPSDETSRATSTGARTTRTDAREPSDDADARPHVFPVRGQMLCFEHDAGEPFVRHVVYTRRGYVVPRRGGRLLAGSTTEHAGFEKIVTGGGVRQVLSHALEIAPALADSHLAEMWAGLRPATRDERPVIGESGEARGLFYATGHYRNGILLSPLTAALLADAITTGARPPLLEPFSPERFRRVGV